MCYVLPPSSAQLLHLLSNSHLATSAPRSSRPGHQTDKHNHHNFHPDAPEPWPQAHPPHTLPSSMGPSSTTIATTHTPEPQTTRPATPRLLVTGLETSCTTHPRKFTSHLPIHPSTHASQPPPRDAGFCALADPALTIVGKATLKRSVR